MSNNKLSDYIQLVITAARVAYGDFSGLIVQGVKYLPKIIAILVVAIIIVIVLPTIFIKSIFLDDSNSPSGTFGELAVEALQYKEDWITVLAIAQTKKTLTGKNIADLAGAAQALKSNNIEDYISFSKESTSVHTTC